MSSLSGNLPRFTMERLTKVESLQEIIQDTADCDDTSANIGLNLRTTAENGGEQLADKRPRRRSFGLLKSLARPVASSITHLPRSAATPLIQI